MCISVYFILRPFPISFMVTEEFANTGFLMQAVYLLVSIVGTRFKYYTAWSVGMVALHATGFTFNPRPD